jgi:hypothetical protein
MSTPSSVNASWESAHAMAGTAAKSAEPRTASVRSLSGTTNSHRASTTTAASRPLREYVSSSAVMRTTPADAVRAANRGATSRRVPSQTVPTSPIAAITPTAFQ